MAKVEKSAAVAEVGCAIILRRPHILIAQRKPGDTLAGFWEFPGGKIEKGETLEECLIREVFEELRVRVQPKIWLCEKTHHYPTKSIRLNFVICDWIQGEPVKYDCHDARWVLPGELKSYRFLPADIDIIEKLQRKGNGLFAKNLRF